VPSSGANPLFVEGGAGTLKLMAYLAAAIMLMAADHRGGYLTQVREFAGLAAGPIYRIAAAPAAFARYVSDRTTSRNLLIEENRTLREQLLLANARLDRLGAVQVENLRLRELLGGTRGLQLSVQLASLVGIDLDPFRHRILLDVGSRRGVREGLAVIDANGVVGQVVDVTPLNSTVMLISDPSHAIPVQVVRSGLRAIAYGTGEVGRLELPSIPLGGDVRVGDELVTSGLGGRFPAGFKVGTIETLNPDDTRLFIVAGARPAARLDRGGQVLLVWNSGDEDGPGFVGPPAEAGADPSRNDKQPANAEPSAAQDAGKEPTR